MNKTRILCLLLAAALMIPMILGGCGEDQEKKTIILPPTPEKFTIESSDNLFGARYTFTLDKISEEIKDDLEKLYLSLDLSDWQTISEGLVDDNNVSYSSYSNHQGKVTFTAAVEHDSGKVMNIGCGCASEYLKDSSFRELFISLAAVIAEHAGGYETDDVTYFSEIFNTLLDGEDDILYYRDSLYIKSVFEGSTVLMTAPCSRQIIREKGYREYKADNR